MRSAHPRAALLRFLLGLLLLVVAMGLACGINPLPTPGAGCGADSGGAEGRTGDDTTGGADACASFDAIAPGGDTVLPGADSAEPGRDAAAADAAADVAADDGASDADAAADGDVGGDTGDDGSADAGGDATDTAGERGDLPR